jgi:hypothetical protein
LITGRSVQDNERRMPYVNYVHVNEKNDGELEDISSLHESENRKIKGYISNILIRMSDDILYSKILHLEQID